MVSISRLCTSNSVLRKKYKSLTRRSVETYAKGVCARYIDGCLQHEDEMLTTRAIINKLIIARSFTEDHILWRANDVHAESCFELLLSVKKSNYNHISSFLETGVYMKSSARPFHYCGKTANGNCWALIGHIIQTGGGIFSDEYDFIWICVCAVLAYGLHRGLERLFYTLNMAFDKLKAHRVFGFNRSTECRHLQCLLDLLAQLLESKDNFARQFWTAVGMSNELQHISEAKAGLLIQL